MNFYDLMQKTSCNYRTNYLEKNFPLESDPDDDGYPLKATTFESEFMDCLFNGSDTDNSPAAVRARNFSIIYPDLAEIVKSGKLQLSLCAYDGPIIYENAYYNDDVIVVLDFSSQVSSKLQSMKLYEGFKWKVLSSNFNTLPKKLELVVIPTNKTSKVINVDIPHKVVIDLTPASVGPTSDYFKKILETLLKRFDAVTNGDSEPSHPKSCIEGHKVCSYIDTCIYVNNGVEK